MLVANTADYIDHVTVDDFVKVQLAEPFRTFTDAELINYSVRDGRMTFLPRRANKIFLHRQRRPGPGPAPGDERLGVSPEMLKVPFLAVALLTCNSMAYKEHLRAGWATHIPISLESFYYDQHVRAGGRDECNDFIELGCH